MDYHLRTKYYIKTKRIVKVRHNRKRKKNCREFRNTLQSRFLWLVLGMINGIGAFTPTLNTNQGTHVAGMEPMLQLLHGAGGSAGVSLPFCAEPHLSSSYQCRLQRFGLLPDPCVVPFEVAVGLGIIDLSACTPYLAKQLRAFLPGLVLESHYFGRSPIFRSFCSTSLFLPVKPIINDLGLFFGQLRPVRSSFLPQPQLQVHSKPIPKGNRGDRKPRFQVVAPPAAHPGRSLSPREAWPRYFAVTKYVLGGAAAPALLALVAEKRFPLDFPRLLRNLTLLRLRAHIIRPRLF